MKNNKKNASIVFTVNSVCVVTNVLVNFIISIYLEKSYTHIINWKIKRVVFGNRHKYAREKSIIIALMASAFVCAFIFGWGCQNTGTAIRHRDKFLSLYVIILGFLSKLDEKTGKAFFIK